MNQKHALKMIISKAYFMKIWGRTNAVSPLLFAIFNSAAHDTEVRIPSLLFRKAVTILWVPKHLLHDCHHKSFSKHILHDRKVDSHLTITSK